MAAENYYTRILLIDEDKEDCSFFQEALSEVAPDVSLSCLEEGVNLAVAVETCRPLLIVIEYKLPKEDGIECVRQLKTHPKYRAIPVIMWSTPHMLIQARAAYQAGIQHYFQKPWSIKELAKKLKTLIGQNHLTGALRQPAVTCI